MIRSYQKIVYDLTRVEDVFISGLLHQCTERSRANFERERFDQYIPRTPHVMAFLRKALSITPHERQTLSINIRR